jgi:2-dehydropantoate 2-reductase
MESKPERTRFLVVGLGALGGVVAHALSADDFDVTVLVRRPDVERIVSTSGLRELRSGTLAKPRVVTNGLNDASPFDFIVMATQPTDVEAALDELGSVLDRGPEVVCLQNGLCEERVALKIGPARVIGAVVTFGAKSHGLGVCEHVPGGGLVIGRLDGSTDARVTRLADCLKALGKVRVSQNLIGIRWSKLVVNCAISTLGTIGGDQLGALLNKAYARELAFEVMGEAVAVARASGVKLERLPGTIPLQWLTASGHDSAGLRASAKRWAQHTAALGLGAKYRRLRSSMLRAIERGHTPAIEFLNGEIVTRGQQLGVGTPINERARELVWAISRGELQASPATLRAFYDSTRATSTGEG